MPADKQLGGTLDDRLQAARAQLFVGREAEVGYFRSLLAAQKLPIAVLCFYGPGGVGKSTLLRRLADEAEASGTPATYLSARGLEANPHTFQVALRQALRAGEGADIGTLLGGGAGRHVLFIDSFEEIESLQAWFRQRFLPRMPAELLVVLAGRRRLDARWKSDPGWQTLVKLMSLRNLSPEEGERLLGRRQVPEKHWPAILNATYGHPLALTLQADLYDLDPDQALAPLESPDVVATLVARFHENVATPAQRAALEAMALVRQLTEALLGHLLDEPEPGALFEWLRRLSFVEAVPGGLVPHALVRDVLAADVRWRDPDRHGAVHQRARRYYNRRLGETSAQRQQELLIDYIYLHRNNPVVRPFYEQIAGSGGAEKVGVTDAAAPDDWPALRAMIGRHEGEESAALADFWWERQPEGFLVFRHRDRRPLGLLAVLRFDALADEAAGDPALEAAQRYLRDRAPLRPGETATYFRFWLDHDSYQGISFVQGLIFVNMVRHYLVTPALAFSFIPCAQPENWAMILGYVDMERLPAADFNVGGRDYGVYGHDWRAMPVDAWLDLLGERETARNPQLVRRPARAPLVVLSRTHFETAVAAALRALNDAAQLGRSPLLQAQIVVSEVDEAEGDEARIKVLQRILHEAVATLELTARGRKYHRAIYHTYLQPAPTQELAAELIDVPYGTYRRHLKRGVEQIVGLLWQREIGK